MDPMKLLQDCPIPLALDPVEVSHSIKVNNLIGPNRSRSVGAEYPMYSHNADADAPTETMAAPPNHRSKKIIHTTDPMVPMGKYCKVCLLGP